MAGNHALNRRLVYRCWVNQGVLPQLDDQSDGQMQASMNHRSKERSAFLRKGVSANDKHLHVSELVQPAQEVVSTAAESHHLTDTHFLKLMQWMRNCFVRSMNLVDTLDIMITLVEGSFLVRRHFAFWTD